jgi:NTP pyrophosphatase (non-canonical NTP hydrolase)
MTLERAEQNDVDFAALQARLHAFALARHWQRYHSPKNLAMSLAIEVGELLECFQWLTDEQARKLKHRQEKMTHVRSEMADVLIYLMHLADVLGVDLLTAVQSKIELNEERFPPKRK